MLLRFSVSNHLSIRDRQELSMIASNLKDRDDGLIAVPGIAKARAVPAAIIFGPNAAGKSNLLLALSFMKEQVLRSHRDGGPETLIPRHPFALCARCKDEPTEVEADFIVDGVRYVYGFAATDAAFEREWLYAYPRGTRRKMFERTSPTDVEFGSALKGQRQVIKELMRPNSLYLSVALQNSHIFLSGIVNFFRSVKVSRNISISPMDIDLLDIDDDLDPRIIGFLSACQTGVSGSRTVSEPIDDHRKDIAKKTVAFIQDLAAESASFDRDALIKRMLEDDKTIELSHNNEDGSKNYFSIDRESSGTRRILHIMRDCLQVLDSGTTMIIDEIDASLHTQICEAIVYLFSDPRINTKGSQLIASTHDTNLLRSQYLRRDQIWLVEKGSDGATELFSLADIKTRAGDNFELGYLQGRYGAVPFTGPVSDLFAAQ